METAGVDNNCLFESGSIIPWGNIKHVQFLKLATVLTGLKLLEQTKQEETGFSHIKRTNQGVASGVDLHSVLHCNVFYCIIECIV